MRIVEVVVNVLGPTSVVTVWRGGSLGTQR